jgi:uncharacterized protein (TIGR03086 family)
VDIIDSLGSTFEHAHGVIVGVRPDQLDDRTPCAEWTVRDLLGHMIGVVAGMGAAVAGRPSEPFVLTDDPAAQFDAASAGALAAWGTPGVLDRVIEFGPGPLPGRVLAGINLLDTSTHTWDLATATGQAPALPDGVARAALEASRQILSPEIRTGRFGPECPAPADAGPTEMLVAFLGRHPSSTY